MLEAEALQLPEDLSPLYRELIDNLTQTLQTEGVIGRAADELRDMIDRIVVSWDQAEQAHRMDLQGNLLEMLKKAKPAELAGIEDSASSLELVAGA